MNYLQKLEEKIKKCAFNISKSKVVLFLNFKAQTFLEDRFFYVYAHKMNRQLYSLHRRVARYAKKTYLNAIWRLARHLAAYKSQKTSRKKVIFSHSGLYPKSRKTKVIYQGALKTKP